MRRDPVAAGQHGSLAVAQAATLCVALLLAGVVVVQAAVLLRAARVAGAAADGAALAAVTATQPGATTTPTAAAATIARAHGTDLVTCDCGSSPSHVRVALAVESRLLALLGITTVHAEADAALVDAPPPDPTASPGWAGRPTAGVPELWFTR